MFLINPYFKTPTLQKAETHAEAVRVWLVANAANRQISLGELKTGLPAIAADLNGAVFAQICTILKLEIGGTDTA